MRGLHCGVFCYWGWAFVCFVDWLVWIFSGFLLLKTIMSMKASMHKSSRSAVCFMSLETFASKRNIIHSNSKMNTAIHAIRYISTKNMLFAVLITSGCCKVSKLTLQGGKVPSGWGENLFRDNVGIKY